ncbi:MAG: cyclic beta 1-2 glucan synthetase, partial [Deltaproteobacteria bacterium]|nr:cyclic beta 1-2 glucan synthetase [Deltaproteobacteria bacterium]
MMEQTFDPPGVYTLHQLELLGLGLASRHHGHLRMGVNSLLDRLKQNEDVLRYTYKLVTKSLLEGHKTTPAGDWLLDNFHVIEEQIRTSQFHLPKSFSRELPMIDDPAWKCQPRIYVLARELINHTDGRLDKDALTCIVTAYQKTTFLRLGELWAFPIMLRLGLIDNLRHIAESIAASYIDQRNAKFWAERMTNTALDEPHKLIVDIADMAHSEPRLSSAFVSEFARHIQTHCHCPSLPLGWVEQRIGDQGLSVEHHQNLASQDQAHDQMSMSNSISSLRFLNEIDWRDFVEKMSGVDALLKQDPSRTYSEMDFETRDTYRHVIEYASRFSKHDELQVATAALTLAQTNSDTASGQSKAMHIGEYLLGPYRRIFERQLHVKPPFFDRIRQFIGLFPLTYYLGLLSLVTCLLAWLPFHGMWIVFGLTPFVLVITLFMILPASQAALAVVNWVTTLIIKPKQWSRMDFVRGVPSTASTIVVVPSIILNKQTIEKLVADLEVRYLGNRDDNIFFALLTDFQDADTETTISDDDLVFAAQNGIRALNAKYAKSETRQPFYFFHRPRLWNPQEGVWMGFERKRGKIAEFNAFLRGGARDRFTSLVGDLKQLGQIRYVITLDADSTLPRETARQLIATKAHPLNCPRVDDKTRMVKKGYAILQPRVTIHLQDSEASRFTRLFSDDFGIDPYTKSVSDVYQDLFHEGTFVGKGIYDVDAFQKALEFRFPQNRILSHDLIESGFARSGLVSDVQLVEEYPTNYSSEVKRKHRWIRGDWQIAAWMLPMAPKENGKMGVNPLSGLARWKIFDNLRRCLSPIAAVLFLFCIWNAGTTLSVTLTLWLILFVALPQLLNAVNFGSWSSPSISYRQAARETMRNLSRGTVLSLFKIILLPYDAFVSADAAWRSLYRLLISKRKLLQWQTADNARSRANDTRWDYLKLMWFAPVCAALGAVFALDHLGGHVIVALPLSAAWFVAPFVAWWISQPMKHKAAELLPAQTEFLRILARRTWLFFETFVTAADNWLPPDNFQDYPSEVIAHRTSPTNIGLGLLSTLGAFDFGYLSLTTFIKKTEDIFHTLETMERFKGHFYNWYDTQTLKPLVPQYISTVDSGNLAGALLVLRQGLLQIADGDLWSNRILEGLDDVLLLIHESVQTNENISTQMRSRISEAQKKVHDLIEDRNKVQSINETKGDLEVLQNIVKEIQKNTSPIDDQDVKEWVEILAKQIEDHQSCLTSLTAENDQPVRATLRALADRATEMMKQDYSFLYNKDNKLLAIGYHVFDSRCDQSYYDLLASEARLVSFLAIANGSLPQEHWFALGRQLVTHRGASILLSWSGSMFEYLMPLLILPSYEGTLLNQACRECIRRQIQYGNDQNVPWGISESGYNITDAQYTYQYRAFGVPGLGFKRGLEQDLVIAPYASAMALMLEPKEACNNLEAMDQAGFAGKFGFYEAIDFTPSRVPVGHDHVIIRSFMAHHQGMTFLSLVRFLLNEPMQRRIESEPTFKATELLLHERVPKASARFTDVFAGSDIVTTPLAEEKTFRVLKDPSRPTPDVHLLGNGNYHVMITSAGSGYSTWKDLMVTRWREDRVRDSYGYFIYIKDTKNSESWSVGFQPLLKKSEEYEVIFTEGRAEIRRSDKGLASHLEIAVSPDDDAELRRLSLSNHGDEIRVVEITTYAEVVLAPAAADLSHPAFSNLFVETEIVDHQKGLLCRRRTREPGKISPWLYHTMVVHGGSAVSAGIETDRARFIGRNRDLTSPAALTDPLTNSAGAVLDPVISIRKRVTILPGSTVVIDCILGISEERDAAIALIYRFEEKQIADRVLELAWTQGHVLLQQLNCTVSDAIWYGKMAGTLVYGGPMFKAQAVIAQADLKPQSTLWSYGISGDHPIIILRLSNQDNLKILHQVVAGHDYWRRRGLAVDLVIWNEDPSGYRQELHDKMLQIISATSSAPMLDKPGGIFIRRPDQMPEEDRLIFQALARHTLYDQGGGLEDQVKAARSAVSVMPKILSPRLIDRKLSAWGRANSKNSTKKENLIFDNGLGGFSPNGREYVIRMKPGKSTPMPWVNVMANPEFGTLVSESGSSYTWSENAHEHRLTPWFNDPVTDPTGEAFYVRDDLTGKYWSLTPSPRPANTDYEARHGFGYSTFSTNAHEISSELTLFVTAEAPVKIVSIKLTNHSSRTRHLSITSYFELVLGEIRSKSAAKIVTEFTAHHGLICGHHIFLSEFCSRMVFLGATDPVSSFTGDRSEFIGRNRSLAAPAAMERVGLSGQVGALFDPCLAMQITCEVEPGATKELAFVFGAGSDYQDARNLAKQFCSLGRVQVALADVHRLWSKLLGRIEIDTPDQSLNLLANGWLLYQTIASRIWGRTGFYQSGGAYGFRDQLQDMMAVVYSAPKIVRKHIIRCAGRQFSEGDVQHWWHPPQGRGVRTKISDDYLWLPYVIDHYIKVTGDAAVLDELVPYLNAKPLKEGMDSDYSLPTISEERGTIYEHCVRALKYGLKFGTHGLPLIGSGDWNDGMNRVGNEGKGESIWLGFFLLDSLNKFSLLADRRGESDFANLCRQEALKLKSKINENGWDGGWYLRAYFDDGTPLGSTKIQECRIDSLPQSWSVLSGESKDARSKQAMDAVYQNLVNTDDRLIQLFDPPFDHQTPNPGYVSEYLQGVRENGGQYTHAALWVVMAFASLGDHDRALELLNFLNPIHHSENPDSVARYQVEPYVVAADTYSSKPHCGRGGWTWYTGSAAWFYRTILESFLSFDLQGDKLRIKPHLPTSWPGYHFKFWYFDTAYSVEVKRCDGKEDPSKITV